MFAASKSGRAVSAATTDPYFPYVPLLLETTSTDGQQNNTFLDSSSNTFTITRNGTPTQGSLTPYWPNGQWSNNFNGSSNLSIASNVALAMGSGSFTIEFWVYLRSATNNRTLAWPVAGNMLIYCDNSGYFAYATYGVGNVLLSSIVTPLNTWTHIAISRTGTNSKIFVNGAIGASTSSDSNNWGQSVFNIGSDIASNFLNGYLSNLRIVKGTGLYTTTFTPPTTPLTAVTNTVLLTCQSNRFKDNSASPLTITVGNGTPTVQAFQPFSPTASYTTALYGGSGYFNGTGSDYLTYTGTALGSGNFTIEFWAYPIETRLNASFYDANNGLIIKQENANIVVYDRTTAANFSTTGNLCIPFVWAHIAVVRNSGVITVYINGVSAGSMSDTSNFTGTGYFVSAFYDVRTSINTFYGYLSNLRVVIGVAVYTGNFTPPILAPLKTAGSTSAASYSSTTNVNTSFAASATSLLTNFTNAGIYDAAVQNNLITVGDAQVSTTITAQWPPTSMKFDGTGDWLTAIDNPQIQLGTGDFTIEGWFYLTANGTAYGIVSKGAASTGWSVNVTSGNRIQFSYTAANLTGATTTLAASTWYYFAIVRSGSATGNLKIYINGALEVTSGGAVTDNFNQTNILYVGASRTGTTPLNGYLQDIRITKAARTITASPTAAFPTR
jgi:hypothetical protein